MKEKRTKPESGIRIFRRKTFLAMKCTLLLLLCSLLQVKAEVFSQQKRVSVQMENVTLDKVFQELRRQADCDFLYNHSVIKEKGKVSVNAKDESLDKLLDELLSQLGMEFVVDDKVIIVREKAPAALAPVKEVLIRGTVKDDKGETLPGATIRIKGTSLGTVSANKGDFVLRVPDNGEITLVFSFVGMKTRELKYAGQQEISMILYPDKQEMEEVVVTGYQVIDKRKLTSAISTIKADQLEKMSTLTIDQMLEGKAPGLMITNVSAQPGAATKIRVRSGGSFTGTREPLWVIDGVIYENPVPLSAADINSLDNVNLIGNAITGLNPQDIAQIDILKDASATAIYGTRAANGVIVVTTKRGKTGSLSLSYNGNVGIVTRPGYKDFNLMNSRERVDVSREICQRNLAFNNGISQFTGYEGALKKYLMKELDYTGFNQEVSRLEQQNTDWFGELYRTGVNNSHSLNLSGGADRVRYYVSLGYDNQKGSERNVGLNRFTARTNLDFDLRKNFLISVGLNSSVQNARYNYSAYSVFNEAYYKSRTIPVRDEKGDLVYTNAPINVFGRRDLKDARYNIINELDNSSKRIVNKDFNVNVSANWEIVRNLRLRSQFSYRNTSNLNEEWIDDGTHFIANLRTYDDFNTMIDEEVNKYSLVPFGGLYSGGSVSQVSWTTTNQLNYSFSLAESHHINVNLGQEATSTSYWGAEGWEAPGYNHKQGRGFIKAPNIGEYLTSDYAYQALMLWMSGQNGKDVFPTITDRKSNTMSYFAILNYAFQDRYILNFNMRSDGSNRFGQYQRYKFRPAWSVSFRWNLHSEGFLANATFLDELALRASYGFRGTPPNASPYLLIKNYGRYDVQYRPESTASLETFPNSDLKWERTSTLNVGLNHSWFGGRISGAIDYSYSRSMDLLLSRPVSLVNGSASQLYNAGSKEDHTFELNLLTQNIKTPDFKWNMNFNITRLKEKVINGFEDELALSSVEKFLNGSIYMKGFPVDGFYSYRFDKLNEKGQPAFKDLVPAENSSIYEQLQKALVYEGNRLPKFYGGFGTEFKYKNVTLSANFSYKAGQKIRLLNLYDGTQNMPQPQENMSSEFVNRWRQPGDEANTSIPGLSNEMLLAKDMGVSSYVVPYGNSLWWMYDRSDLRTVKGDYIRWQSLTLAYNLPEAWLKRIGVTNARISAQAQNLAVWAFDSGLKGQDPEQVQGVGMPVLPSYNFGLTFSF